MPSGPREALVGHPERPSARVWRKAGFSVHDSTTSISNGHDYSMDIWGARTIRIFLERQGHVLGTDRMYRLWRQERLQVPKKRPRRRVAASRPRPVPPTAINHVWAYDFVFDTCAHSHLEVPDRHRRVHAGVSRDRCRRRHPLGARHRGPRAAREPPRRAALSPVGQRSPSLSRARFCDGYRPRRSRPRSSIRVSPGRTAPTNPSTGSFAISIYR